MINPNAKRAVKWDAIRDVLRTASPGDWIYRSTLFDRLDGKAGGTQSVRRVLSEMIAHGEVVKSTLDGRTVYRFAAPV